MQETYNCILAHPAIFFHVSMKHLKNTKITNIDKFHFLTLINAVYELELKITKNFYKLCQIEIRDIQKHRVTYLIRLDTLHKVKVITTCNTK